MFAVVKTGGKQYCVRPGDVLKIEKLEAEEASVVELGEVLMTNSEKGGLRVGTPMLAGAVVKAEVLRHSRDPKIVVFKKKRRHNYRRKNGHRQPVTIVKIVDIAAQ
ncbi:MAG: 50S ribosomal protein L21 [Holosporales bacterium]|jgi:large subunit ribosomal protein L21|nr:50S ribosomal protein L21 [Holosporales bacterium]